MKNTSKCRVWLAPTIEVAQSVKAAATVEAEYGGDVVNGIKVTLAHHGPRAGNPAPCNASSFEQLEDGDTIVISHIDLDTIGGVLALMGKKYEDSEFWKWAEFIDIKGRHHLHELPEDIQDELNAYFWFTTTLHLPRFDKLTDVTDIIERNREALDIILDERHPQHQEYINAGKEWARINAQRIENCLVEENPLLRVFDGRDGTSCAAGYYSPTMQNTSLATLSLNKFQGITLGLSDEAIAMGLNASQIMQTLYGPGAGGREGIAGTPRGNVYTKEDLVAAAQEVQTAILAHGKRPPVGDNKQDERGDDDEPDR